MKSRHYHLRESRRFLLVVFLFASATIFFVSDTAGEAGEPSSHPSIVGIWKLVEFINWQPDGTKQLRFGEKPLGVFVYSPDGHLSLHAMKSPPPPLFSSETTDKERGQAARDYIGYFGTYDVDYDRGVVTHNIEGALVPNRISGSFERPFRLNGDTLELDFKSEDGRRYYRRLERVEEF